MTASQAADSRGVSLYFHVPFCASKCAYCSFLSEAGVHQRTVSSYPSAPSRVALLPADATVGGAYVQAALAFLDDVRTGDASLLLADVPTVYIGGGTPTVLGGDLVRLVEGVTERVTTRPDAEFTVEANPESVSAELIAQLKAAGVGRFSLGVQSFDGSVLGTLGRCHDAAAASEAASVLRDEAVRFSVDLICGVPGQSADSWRDTLDRAIATGAGHLSVYPLSIDNGTALAAAVDSGVLSPPDPDTAADMMLLAEEKLTAAGLERYEVASYARPGEEGRHNLRYWTGGAYLGVGPSAAGMLPAASVRRSGLSPAVLPAPKAETARVRFTLDDTLADFLGGSLPHPAAAFEELSAAEAAREDVMLGLRLTRGVLEDDVVAAGPGAKAALERLRLGGLVERAVDDGGETRWRTTRRGWLLGNDVFGEVWNADDE